MNPPPDYASLIPAEAVEAFQKAWANRDTLSTRECLAAMLAAWPNLSKGDARQWSVMPDMPILILPLPTEPKP